MIIPNSYVKLDYNPTTDVLVAELPDFRYYEVPEAKYILSTIVDTVRHYNVHYLITDTRGKIQNVPDSTYKEVVVEFAQGLSTTNLKKIARLADIHYSKQNAAEEVRLETGFPIPVMHLYSIEECLKWLLDK